MFCEFNKNENSELFIVIYTNVVFSVSIDSRLYSGIQECLVITIDYKPFFGIQEYGCPFDQVQYLASQFVVKRG
jgi:hypothetical protein